MAKVRVNSMHGQWNRRVQSGVNVASTPKPAAEPLHDVQVANAVKRTSPTAKNRQGRTGIPAGNYRRNAKHRQE